MIFLNYSANQQENIGKLEHLAKRWVEPAAKLRVRSVVVPSGELMRLANKVCLVTGSASGIGEACAKTYAREGGKVVIADRNVEGAQRVAAEIRAGRR